MIEIIAIDHLVLRTNNLSALVDFYVGVLGCVVERKLPEEMGLTQLRAGTALIDLVAVDSELGRIGGAAPSAKGNNLDHFCLSIKPQSEDAIKSYLSAHGVKVENFSERYGAEGFGNSIYIQDPDGNTVELRNRVDNTKS